MKIHLMGDILSGNHDDYKRIAALIAKRGDELITHHILDRTPQEIIKESSAESELYAKKIYSWIKKADVVIFEVTVPTVSVGFEAATALNLSKPVVMLYREAVGSYPPALKGLQSDKLQVLGYNDNTLQEILNLAIDYAQETSDVRFNFFISPSIGHYLEWIAKNKKIPRSVYLRKLIEDDMLHNSEYDQSSK